MGPAVALRSYKALLGGADRSVLLRAAMGAFRCALALDELELATVCAYWETLIDVEAGEAIVELTVPLCARGRFAAALMLAAAESVRRPTAASLYLHARVLEASGRPSEEVYARAAALGEGSLRATAQSKQLEAMLARQAALEEQLAVADAIDLTAASPAARLLAATVRLRGSGRFTRAAALSTLAELASGPEPALARRAIRVAAEHADHLGGALSWVEGERVAAALEHWPDELERRSALARLGARRGLAAGEPPEAVLSEAAGLEPGYRRHLEQARALVAGYAIESDPPPDNRELVLVDRCLRAFAAIEHASFREAELLLRELCAELGRDAAVVPPPVWALIARAARIAPGEGAHVGGTAVELLETLERSDAGTPSQGWLSFADVARRLRASELEERLLVRATRRDETGAVARLVEHLVRRAWRAFGAGERAQALAVLRRARSLASDHVR